MSDKKYESFEEWHKLNHDKEWIERHDYAQSAWNHQQKKIDELERIMKFWKMSADINAIETLKAAYLKACEVIDEVNKLHGDCDCHVCELENSPEHKAAMEYLNE